MRAQKLLSGKDILNSNILSNQQENETEMVEGGIKRISRFGISR
jgi:hypothetical protein